MRELSDHEMQILATEAKIAEQKSIKEKTEKINFGMIEIINKSFPDLFGFKIQVDIVPDKELPDSYLEYGSQGSNFFISICCSMSQQNDDVLIGGIVHELCHIANDRYGNWFEQFIYDHNLHYRKLIERNTDLDTIIRGYGKELLAYVEWHFAQIKRENLISEYEGITLIELQKILEVGKYAKFTKYR